jgi:hypothetical protein
MRQLKIAASVAGVAIVVFAARPVFARLMAPSRAAELEPRAVAALTAMATQLQRLRAFHVEAVTSREQVLTDGQKLQFESHIVLLAENPNRLRIVEQGDRAERTFYYDGRAFTAWAPRRRSYSTVAAPPTIALLADSLLVRFDLELPLVDLFRWGQPGRLVSALRGARHVGPSDVGGALCDQYALRQEGLDWQIWIEKGERRLPCRVVLTTLTDAARPQFTATYTWTIPSSFDDSTFAFVPPADARPSLLDEVVRPRLRR